ncbi:type I site-specific deoxyribonuclease, HsdR family [Hymenobacter roseosalivarius DSM 11622]|uniref:type I site-specific deoxyribonuclease n=1 Tax=Hymenobacter roseosalivarius DSM 11622 TaxID=645990 RepID=A0A1W1VFL8_9BACT|nr:type I restriction endonuclease subunit R [Hymenobacter roseosalivarius]SMB92135.1 type I site-specific deoxyribonuclease, HsdR family [Hymenobacter roseosalivarius DSM 11622]
MSSGPEFVTSEEPALALLQQLGYYHLPGAALAAERPDITQVVLPQRLRAAIARLNPLLDATNQQKAFDQLTSVAAASLMETNQRVWELLRGDTLTLKQTLASGEVAFVPVRFLDYATPATNEFLAISQLKFHGKHGNSIPDVVVYVNGLPLGVLECKASGANNAWGSAYSDLEFYQRNSERLFHYNQLCAGIWGIGARYGAIGTPQPFYSHYRAPDDEPELLALLGGKIPTAQDKLLYYLFQPERLLDLVRHFVLFELDEGRIIKKLPRYQQVRAVNKTIAKLQAHQQGGVVWHTQGSGKSLTMAYLARKLQAPEYGFDNPTVLVLTDRKDLDQQITTTFQNVGFKSVQQASSVRHLERLLRNDYGGIITTTLQKFQQADKDATDETDTTNGAGNPTDPDDTFDDSIAPILPRPVLTSQLIEGNNLVTIEKELVAGKWVEVSRTEIELVPLSKKQNIYVLVDEAHRSHYGFLAAFMRTVLPHAKFVAFTGTPISKEDKSTLAEFYGDQYLDVYTIVESVVDGATVPLLYDAGIARLDVKKAELDAEFEVKFGHESEEKKGKLKDAALLKYQLSTERVTEIAKHLLTHFRDKIYKDEYKALLVCSGRRAALQYQQVIEQLRQAGFHDFTTKVVVSMGSPKSDPLAEEQMERLNWNKDNPHDPKPLLATPAEEIKAVTEDFKLPFGNEAELDQSGTRKKYDNTAILIVSDMLLTGYDAPIAGCLYLDKPLKAHNLLQAIARVNRTYKSKAAGYIVDYSGITQHLIQALEIFSGDVRPDDILKNLNEEIPQLELNHAKLLAFCKPLKANKGYQREGFIDECIQFIEPLHRRDEFKALLKSFNKSVNIVLPNQAAMKYQGDFKLFNEIKVRARNTYPDDEELKISKDESKMLQQLINEHLLAAGVQNLLEEPVSIIDREKFKQEILNASPGTKMLKMRNQLKHVIKLGMDRNPDFYKPLAQRLEELLKEYEAQRLDQAQLLLAFSELADTVSNENQEGNAEGFHTESQIAVFNSMKTIFDGQATAATHELFELVSGELEIVGWRDKGEVRNTIESKIRKLLSATMERPAAKEKAKELVEILRKN